LLVVYIVLALFTLTFFVCIYAGRIIAFLEKWRLDLESDSAVEEEKTGHQ
jgi:low affinity Fe/Cu permease